MAAVALTLGLLLAFLVALLAVPLTVAFSVHRVEQTRGEIRFRWLFGLVRFRLRFPRDGEDRSQGAPAPARRAKSSRRAKRKGRAVAMLSLIRESAFRQRIHRFIRDMFRATHPRDLFLRLRIGLGDPADTGLLWALVGPVAGMAQNVASAVVRIEPDFIDPAFEVEGHGRFRLVPIQFIATTLTFLLSPTMLRAWWRLARRTG